MEQVDHILLLLLIFELCLSLLPLFLTVTHSCGTLKTWQEDCPAYKLILPCVSVLVPYCFGWYCIYLMVICIYLFIFFCCWNIFHGNIVIWNILKLAWHWDITKIMPEVIYAVVLMVTSWLNHCTYNSYHVSLMSCSLVRMKNVVTHGWYVWKFFLKKYKTWTRTTWNTVFLRHFMKMPVKISPNLKYGNFFLPSK